MLLGGILLTLQLANDVEQSKQEQSKMARR
jgi:hypothetical protein